MKCVALLRGINISGKNKIDMKELKAGFETLGFANVKTVLNSGNVIFESPGIAETGDPITGTETGMNIDRQKSTFAAEIATMIAEKFSISIPVMVLLQGEIEDILQHAPAWWGSGSKEIYDNLIFILPGFSFSEVSAELGEINAEIEQVENYKNVVFWSFSLKNYRKSAWYFKTAAGDVKDKITIRTAGTTQKLVR
ncbi:MAG: DUF1697 domain-containing protein [Treponemataceae bacterium]|nr:DUF1697 domain-containing protein [Treponemataceae bacterium]